jgi:hypothetical protein
MLGLPQSEVQKIAQMPTEHSWLTEIMLDPQMEEREEKLEMWLEKEGEKLQKNSYVGRIVRETYALFLERVAIEKYVEENPQMMGYLPILNNPIEAVSLGAREAMADDMETQVNAIKLMVKLYEMKSSPV